MTHFNSFVDTLWKKLNSSDPNNPYTKEEVEIMLLDELFAMIDDHALEELFDKSQLEDLEDGKLDRQDILRIVEQKLPKLEQKLKESVDRILAH